MKINGMVCRRQPWRIRRSLALQCGVGHPVQAGMWQTDSAYVLGGIVSRGHGAWQVFVVRRTDAGGMQWRGGVCYAYIWRVY